MGTSAATEGHPRSRDHGAGSRAGIGAATVAGSSTALLLAWFADASIGVHDCGELAAGSYVLGVTHPAGSPLWLMLARGFELLPLAGSPAARMALLSALAGGVAAAVAALLLARRGAAGPTAAALGPCVVLVPRMLWACQMAEVYALQTAATLVLLLTIDAAGHRPHPRRAALAGLAGGLCLSVHHALAPAVTAAVILTGGSARPRVRGVVAALAGLAIGLTPYLEVPVRAVARPAHCWGDPSTLGRLWAHLSSAQYRGDVIGGGDAWQRLAEAAMGLSQWLGWVALLLAAGGMALLVRRRPVLAVTVALVAVNELAVFAVAQSMPLASEAYLTVTSALLALAAVVAIAAVLERAPPLRRLAALAPLALVWTHGGWLTRDAGVARWTTARLFAACPAGSVVWLREDTTAFAAVYHQLVEGWRPDLTLLHPWSVVGAPHLPPDLVLHRDREVAAAQRQAADRALYTVARATRRTVLHQDPVHHSLSLPLEPSGALWSAPPTPDVSAAAMLSPLPGEGRWSRHPDPTIRGLLASQHLPLAASRARLGDLAGARLEARLAWRCGPTFASVHRALGQRWLDLDLVDEAVAELQRALDLEPADASAWLELGVARARSGALEPAEAAWRRAAALRPGWAPPLLNLGRAAIHRGDTTAARAILEQAWRATGDPEARRLLDALAAGPVSPQRR